MFIVMGDSQNYLKATVLGSTKPTKKNVLQMNDWQSTWVLLLELLLYSLFLAPASDSA